VALRRINDAQELSRVHDSPGDGLRSGACVLQRKAWVDGDGTGRDFLECGKGTGFVLASMGSKPGGHTQMSFEVDDVAAVVTQLKSKGVVFEEYDFPDLKTVNSIAERPDFKAAWFKDSEGNMIGIGQRL
jgi:hypothetical protein